MERLQKVIANSGYCSRRKAEEYIVNGKVKVNGSVVRKLGVKVSFSDQISVCGTDIKKEDKEYILLYKPRGVITSASDDKGRKTVLDLIDTKNRLYPVGRLDYDTSGVLLLTNDGEITNKLTHPKRNIEKVYIAKIDGIIRKDDLKVLCKGVVIDGRKTSKAKARIRKIDKKKNTSIVEITIHEGRNHQIKKMFNYIGFNVIKLKREVFAGLTLSGLSSGKYRHLSIKEVKILYSLVD
ncbi:MAG: rRNA pseudouridine synthase [Bacilli bacterium]|nr:rRNA pseudouridine synthase [Bacilli bacterium]